MKTIRKTENKKEFIILTRIFISLIFIFHFIYFAIFNRYHLAFQEQIQLFCYNFEYFKEFFSKPGGLAEYAGNFLIQFYTIPFAGALIVTLISIVTFLLSRSLLIKLGIKSLTWQLIPVFLITILQSDYVYYIGYTIAFLLTITFYVFHTTLKNNIVRLVYSIVEIVSLYVIGNEFAVLLIALIFLYEFLYIKNSLMNVSISFLTTLLIFLHYLFLNHVYLLPDNFHFINPLLVYGNNYTRFSMFFLLSFFPLLILIHKFLSGFSMKLNISIKMNMKSFLICLVLLFAFSFFIINYVYDYKTELLLGIDNNVQKEKWDQALKLSSKLQEINPIAVYLTNIALYKTNRLGNEMFHYEQIGTAGLFLDWGSEFSPFFGNEVFYQLGYINEAYRWSFEAMVSKGQTPRILKKLVLTSIINYDYKIAQKYLNVLKKTLFYRKWAIHYLNLISDPAKIETDNEIREKRHFLIHSDFFANVTNYESVLINLLNNHSDNRMAFEYLMSYFLLRKDLISFVKNIYRLKEFNIKEIPVHYEEALLLANALNNIPEGYSIRESTKQVFYDYVKTYVSFTGNPDKLQEILYNRFGKSYLYYYQFK